MSHRVQITLEDDQYEWLQAASRRRGLGMAELVRRALDLVYGQRRRPDDVRSALEGSFGSWSATEDDAPGRDVLDGEASVEHLRSGMSARSAEVDR